MRYGNAVVWVLVALVAWSAQAAAQAGLSATPKEQAHYTFQLTRGHGTPVCEAYLQRLNSTQFEEPPYCGIPENDSIPGFARLNRKYLTEKEIRKLFSIAQEFATTGAQIQGRPGETFLLDKLWTDKNGKVPAWRYQPPIDIDNDGSKDSLLVWQGLWQAGSPGAVCGGPEDIDRGPGWAYSRSQIDQRAFVLKSRGDHIDESRTRDIFWRKLILLGQANFTPITLTTDFFSYRKKYYFDGFYNAYDGLYGDFEGKRVSDDGSQTTRDSGLGDTLAVFLREKHKTRLVCEYQMTVVQSGSP